MIKYKHLSFTFILCTILTFAPLCSFAQSEMDLLLEENKKDSIESNDSDAYFLDMLSDTITDDKNSTQKTEDSTTHEANNNNNSGTWLNFLLKKVASKNKNTASQDASEEENINDEDDEDIEDFRIKSNAAYFDISRVRLRMKPSEVEKILEEQGYRKISENFEIPNFIEWRAEELCRLSGVIGFERLAACTTRIAQSKGHQFIEMQTFNRHTTRETIEVNYTSSFTDNVSYRIYYKSNLPMSDSKNSKHVYINNVKIFDFWRRIDLKYGKPDNASEVKWGFGGKKPFLQAKTGELVLMDPLLVSLDTTRMYNEDSQMANVQYYNF